MFKTDISVVLTVMSGLDPHRLVLRNKKGIADGYGGYLIMVISITLVYVHSSYCLYNISAMGWAMLISTCIKI